MGQCLSPGETTVELDILGAHLDIRVRAAYMSARQGTEIAAGPTGGSADTADCTRRVWDQSLNSVLGAVLELRTSMPEPGSPQADALYTTIIDAMLDLRPGHPDQ